MKECDRVILETRRIIKKNNYERIEKEQIWKKSTENQYS